MAEGERFVAQARQFNLLSPNRQGITGQSGLYLKGQNGLACINE